MIYHDIPWYTMINHDIESHYDLQQTRLSSCGTRSPGWPGRIRTCWSPSRSLITASSLQNSSSPISSAEVRRKPRCREFCREFPHQKWTKTKVVFIILRGMGVIWKSDLTCLNYSQVISCDITVAISTTSTRSNTLLGGWNPYIPRPQPRNCLHQTLVSAQRSPWQHPGEQKTQGCPKAGSPQIPVCFSPMSQGGHHQNCHELDHSGANDLKKKSSEIIISLYQFFSIQTAISARIRAGQTHNATGHGTPRNAMPV